MSGLPASALAVLSEVSEELSRKPIAVAVTRGLTALEVRRSLQTAARAASAGQVPGVLYAPGHAPSLVVLRASDLGDLAKLLKRTENDDAGSAA